MWFAKESTYQLRPGLDPGPHDPGGLGHCDSRIGTELKR